MSKAVTRISVIYLPLKLQFVVIFGHCLAVLVDEFLPCHVRGVLFHLNYPVLYLPISCAYLFLVVFNISNHLIDLRVYLIKVGVHQVYIF